MRNQFYHHAPMTNEELADLWEKCIFVFDTNVLLSFYRYSPSTVEELEGILNSYKERIWLPNQVGVEFFKNRLIVIQEQVNNYENTLSALENINSLFSRKRGHPFVEENVMQEFMQLSAKVKQGLSNGKDSMLDLLAEDGIANSIVNAFDAKVGDAFTCEQLNDIYEEGKVRYEKKIPPGFMDKKPEPDKYGDLVIWKQIIEKSKQERRPIIFICDDAKEDWWLKVKGKIVSSLPELVKEFKEETGQRFYMYNSFRFIEYVYNNQNVTSSQLAVNEIKQVGSTSKNLFDYNTIEIILLALEDISFSINGLTEYLESMGYIPSVEVVADKSFKLILRVPFEDLVRRVEKKVKSVVASMKLEIVSFNYYPDAT